MQLFPERYERRDNRLLRTALIISLLVHLIAFLIAARFGTQIATTVARVVPRPTPTPEIVALSDAITIEKRTVPRPQHRAHPSPPRQPPPQRPQPRSIARLPAPPIPVPTLAPVATPQPTRVPVPVPTMHSQRAVVHRPLPAPTTRARPEPTVRARPVPTLQPSTNALSAQQIAQMQSQFRRTIDSAERQLTQPATRGGPTEVRPQRDAPSARKRYAMIMAGTPDQFLAAFQGDCVALQGPMPLGSQRSYYIQCVIQYNDGYFETVSIPWIYRFTRQNDPFDQRENPNGLSFAPQPPPAGYQLPRNFALSRAVCAFFRARCAAVINAETARGEPAYAKPPPLSP